MDLLKSTVPFSDEMQLHHTMSSWKKYQLKIFNHFCFLKSSHNKAQSFFLYKTYVGLPWWRSGWESACRCRGHGFVPRSGKIPHAAERLGPWATAAESARPQPVLRNGRGHNSERPAYRKKKKLKKKLVYAYFSLGKKCYCSLESHKCLWTK